MVELNGQPPTGVTAVVKALHAHCCSSGKESSAEDISPSLSPLASRSNRLSDASVQASGEDGVVPEREPLFPVRNFRVFLGSREVGFCHVEGLVSETVAAADCERLEDRWRPVVLRRALGTDRLLFEWRGRAAAGRRYPRDVALDHYDGDGERCVNTFVLQGAWPVRWSGPVFEATSDAIAFEELELAYERVLWMEKPGSRPTDTTEPKVRGTHGRSA
jgi:hypothetical protein